MRDHSDEPSPFDDIETQRLRLRLLPPTAISTGLAGDLATIEKSLGANVPADLLQDARVLRHARDRLVEDAGYLPWSARAIILKDEMQMIGHVRFHTRPDPEYLYPYVREAVEFGYVVFGAYRRRGYAQEALVGLMHWAERSHGVGRFIVSISPDNQPSTNLAAKLGFIKIGEWLDQVDGVEYVYLLDVSQKS